MNLSTELVWVNHAAMDPGQQIQEHSHICYQMYYILQGNPIFIINGNELCAHPHSFFYIPPNTPHRMLPLSTDKMFAYDLKFTVLDQIVCDMLPSIPVLLTDDNLAEKMLSFIVSNWECKTPEYATLLDHLLSSLLSCFYLDEIKHDHRDDWDSHHIDTSTYNPVTRSVLAYIEKNYYTQFSLTKLAEDLNYNKNYLSTIFSKTTGISIVDYLNLIRIRKAVIFFALHNQDVFTTYESIGFTSPSHFSRVFKSLVGICPRSFKYAFSMLDRQSRSQYFTQEPLLNYRICSMEEAFASLRSIGQAADSIIKRICKDNYITNQ